MTLALVAVFATYAVEARDRREEVREVPFFIDISYDLFAAIQDIRLERGSVNRALAAPAPADQKAWNEIEKERADSGTALESGLNKLSAFQKQEFSAEITEIQSSRDAFKEVRLRVDDALTLAGDGRAQDLPDLWLQLNARFVRAIDELASRLESELSRGDPFVANMIRVKQLVWPVRADSGGPARRSKFKPKVMPNGRWYPPRLRRTC